MKLYRRKYGSGPPLIILHALYGSSDNWVHIAKRLSGSFTCYLPDQRNHGRSPHSSEHNYPVMSNDIDELAVELQLGKFFLAGHSMGGKTAIYYALKHPEKLSGLLVADISPFTTDTQYHRACKQHINILSTIIDSDLRGLSTRTEVESLIGDKIKSGRIRDFIMKNLERRPDSTLGWKLNARALFDNLSHIMEGIERPGTDTEPVTGFPVIFLKGELSDYLPDTDFRDIQRIFPSAELIKVRQAGHWIQADSPDKVAEGLLRLLG